MKFTIKKYKDGKKVNIYRTGKIRRFLKYIRTVKFQDWTSRVYLKVDYGKALDNFGKYTSFYNDGDYYDPESFWLAFNAFIED